jgi:hypothetical protein
MPNVSPSHWLGFYKTLSSLRIFLGGFACISVFVVLKESTDDTCSHSAISIKAWVCEWSERSYLLKQVEQSCSMVVTPLECFLGKA